MSLNRTVKDEDILNGFASLHQAMATGFDHVRAEMRAGFDQVWAEFGQVRVELHAGFAHVNAEILDVRNDVARLEQRMLRRFDDIDERLDRHETRISALENRASTR
jgi:hypothetical protein